MRRKGHDAHEDTAITSPPNFKGKMSYMSTQNERKRSTVDSSNKLTTPKRSSLQRSIVISEEKFT